MELSQETFRTNKVLDNIIEYDPLLAILQESMQEELVPQYIPHRGIFYRIKNIDITLEQIEELEKRGLIRRTGFKSFSVCPVCGYSLSTINLVCPSCKTQTLIKSEFLLHYECNYLGEISEFIKDTEQYVCPKCRKELKKVGIDYGRPGKLYKCKKCNEITQFPLVMLECMNHHVFKIDEVELKTYPIYSISLSSQITIIRDIFEELRMALKYFSPNIEIRYLDRVEIDKDYIYIVPISIIEKNRNLKILIDFIFEEKEYDEKLIKILRASLKLDVTQILVIKSDIFDSEIFNPKRITVLKIRKTDKNEIIARILSVIFSKIA